VLYSVAIIHSMRCEVDALSQLGLICSENLAAQAQDPAVAHFATRIIIQGHRVEIISVSVHSCPCSAGTRKVFYLACATMLIIDQCNLHQPVCMSCRGFVALSRFDTILLAVGQLQKDLSQALHHAC
jgi:hypothetical protein